MRISCTEITALMAKRSGVYSQASEVL